MKQESAKTKLFGAEGFEEYYKGLYGERWDKLKEAFAGEGSSVEYHVTGAEKSYFLDSASVLAALCLPLEGASDILDLCAAPGGKTLVLASRMPEDAHLSSNERSPERKHRLAVVVETCLPTSISERVKTSCSDGATWCTRQSECFDRILLDAPCSSERHVIADPKYLNSWSPSRIKTVTTEQWALLSSAYRLLSAGGILLYSTCALCPDENDGMIERLYKKFNKEGDAFTLIEPSPDISEISDFADISLPGFEKTKYGYMIMPDQQNGAGPIYFSIIRKEKTI
ncbi:16S rRNA methyltransferase RsmF [Treponema bryantii]|uniref:NOL1/NOP2/Sun domain family member 4 n=1 Tax=Treponema bryantii TaxID=163 RepID=A0A1I3JGH6_9SPIR|nr:RNA methyltransferase [Treponema bryantii]SFI59392.1 16S rRNA methyltransferase RsmF [Treponema bryantii]